MEQKEEYKKFLEQIKKGQKVYKGIIQRRIDNMPEEDKELCEIYCSNNIITDYVNCKEGNWKLVFFENNSILLITNDKTDASCQFLVSQTIGGILPENKTIISNLPHKQGNVTVCLMKIEDIF